MLTYIRSQDSHNLWHLFITDSLYFVQWFHIIATSHSISLSITLITQTNSYHLTKSNLTNTNREEHSNLLRKLCNRPPPFRLYFPTLYPVTLLSKPSSLISCISTYFKPLSNRLWDFLNSYLQTLWLVSSLEWTSLKLRQSVVS